MDERAVARRCVEAFVRLYDEGLIYRAQRLINWCPTCRTALSDLEVEHDEARRARCGTSPIRCPTAAGELVVATTRPETMLGDTAVAVHPDDPRFNQWIGKEVELPLHRARDPRHRRRACWSTSSSAPARSR